MNPENDPQFKSDTFVGTVEGHYVYRNCTGSYLVRDPSRPTERASRAHYVWIPSDATRVEPSRSALFPPKPIADFCTAHYNMSQ